VAGDSTGEFAEIIDTAPADWGIAGAKAIAAQTIQRLPVRTFSC
jgi:hypothetical protein